MNDINGPILAFASIYIIITGLFFKVTGGPAWQRYVLWIPLKIMPIAAGIIISFNLYARFMGWPV